jgi:peptidoglycan/xylan/chitin deacetylase (PgdA/CDA1 family)
MMDALDRHGIRASALLNSDVCRHYPQIIEAGRQRNWAWLAHGRTNSVLHTGLSPAEEPSVLKDIVETIADATGQRPKGWTGPALTETFETQKILKEVGLSYVLDWCADDQPFALNIPGMIAVPYTVELNDNTVFVANGGSGEDFYQAVVDQFDQLYEDSAQSGRVMALALHPFVIGQPFRHRYLAKALAYIASREEVWLTTSDDIAAHYLDDRMARGAMQEETAA